MEIIIRVVSYLVVASFFIASGKFLKECDKGMDALRHKQ